MLIYDDLDIGGEYLGVDMNARLVGVASGLSRIMAAAVKKARKPVFFYVAIQGETSERLSRWVPKADSDTASIMQPPFTSMNVLRSCMLTRYTK